MKKSKKYTRVVFDADAITAILNYLKKLKDKGKMSYSTLSIERDNEEWHLENVTEFLAEMRRGFSDAVIVQNYETISLRVSISNDTYTKSSRVTVEGKSRGAIEECFEVFEANKGRCGIPKEVVTREPDTPVVFIGHGQNVAWRELKDHLSDKHGVRVEAYETGSRAGHAIRDVLDDMLTNSSIAFIVLTGEDEGVDGVTRARENVIHELGLFQGELGFSRAIALLEHGTNEFSNLHGIQQIRFSKNNIRETFGEVLAVLKREFDDSDPRQDE